MRALDPQRPAAAMTSDCGCPCGCGCYCASGNIKDVQLEDTLGQEFANTFFNTMFAP